MKRIYTHQWEIYWEGPPIVVKVWIDSLLRGGENVFIDEIEIPNDEWEPWRPQQFSDFRHALTVNNEVRELRIHVGLLVETPPERGDDTGCLVLLDGVPIGGDIESKFKTIEPNYPPNYSAVTNFRDLVEETRRQAQPPEDLPWWVWVYSWVVTHRLRTLLVLGFAAYVVWEATIGD